jgi:hypothetical protein
MKKLRNERMKTRERRRDGEIGRRVKDRETVRQNESLFLP